MADHSLVNGFCFGPFRLDPATGELFRDGVLQKLQPQPVRLLTLLMSKTGELVTREELRDALWPDGTSVEFDQGLNYCIRQIRAVLGESASEPQYIETLPKRGYRFIGQVQKIEAIPTSPKRWNWWPSMAAALGLLLGCGAYLALSEWNPPNPPKSILVRPFIALGLAEADEWIGDAMTQQLIGTLSNTKAVRVMPWSTSLAIRGNQMGIAAIGKRFGVDAILEGSVRRNGDRVQVSAQLVDTATERTIWSHQDERGAGDLAQIETKVFEAMAAALKFRIAGGNAQVSRIPPADADTYRLYLRSLVLGDQFSRNSVKAAVEGLEDVVRRAPNFSIAKANLANLQVLQSFSIKGDIGKELARVQAMAEETIALDPSLAEAHTALAHTYLHQWRWKQAEQSFETALSLNPDSAMAHQLFAVYLGTQGRWQEALRHADRAAELAPTSALVEYSRSTILLHGGEYEKAIASARQTLLLDRMYSPAYTLIVRAYALQGKLDQAEMAFRESERINKLPNQSLWWANLLALRGEQQEARALLLDWEATRKKDSRLHLAFGLAWIRLGDMDRGFAALRQSIDEHALTCVWLKNTPELAVVKQHPRMAALLMELDGGGKSGFKPGI